MIRCKLKLHGLGWWWRLGQQFEHRRRLFKTLMEKVLCLGPLLVGGARLFTKRWLQDEVRASVRELTTQRFKQGTSEPRATPLVGHHARHQLIGRLERQSPFRYCTRLARFERTQE